MGVPWWLATAILLAAAIIQASFVPALGFVSVRPDLVLQLVVIWAVMRGVRQALPWAFVGGMLLDLLSGAPMGTASLALVLVAFCSSVGEISVFRSNLLLPIVTVFWASVLYYLIFLFLLRSHQYPIDWLATLRQTVVPNAILNTLLAPLPYALLSRIEQRTRRIVPVEW